MLCHGIQIYRADGIAEALWRPTPLVYNILHALDGYFIRCKRAFDPVHPTTQTVKCMEPVVERLLGPNRRTGSGPMLWNVFEDHGEVAIRCPCCEACLGP